MVLGFHCHFESCHMNILVIIFSHLERLIGEVTAETAELLELGFDGNIC